MYQSGVKPRINGMYDVREVEPLDHSMSRTYRDHQIRIFTNAYWRNTLLPNGYITQVDLN